MPRFDFIDLNIVVRGHFLISSFRRHDPLRLADFSRAYRGRHVFGRFD